MNNHFFKAALAMTILVSGCDEEGTVIDERGGIIVSDDGRFSLEIPAGALEQPVDITLEQVECDEPQMLGVCYEMGPVGLPLLRPGLVSYELDPEELDGVEPSALTLLTEREEDWRPLADRRVEMADEVVTGSAIYLSSYALVVED